MAKEIIKARNLSVHFNRDGKLYKAVDRVDFTVNQGEILAVVGESGSGKTTLGRALLGLWDHSTGGVRIEGKKVPNKRVKYVTGKNRWIYEKGQMIYQDPTSSLNEVKKVSEILSEGLNNFKILEKERDHKLAKLEKELEVLERNHKLKHDHIAVIEEDVQRQLDKNIEQLRTKFRTADPEYKEQIKINKQRKELILKIEEIKKSLFWSDKIGKRDIDILKKEKTSNRIILKEKMDSDKFELLSSKADEKEEAKIKDVSTYQTRAFKTGNKIIESAIINQISEMNVKVTDIAKKITKWNKISRAEKDPALRKIFVADVATWKYEEKLLKEIREVYKDFKITFDNETKKLRLKKVESSKEYYSALFADNEKAFTILVSFNAWKYKNLILRAEKMIKYKADKFNSTLADLQARLTKTLKEFDAKKYHASVAKIEDKITAQITVLTNKAKNEIARRIKNLPENKKFLTNTSAAIDNVKGKINLTKNSLNGAKRKETLEAKLIEVLEQVGLSPEALDKYPSQFSGGQKQRIGIARSILTQPKFIIADEPISALDVSLQAGVVNLLKDLQKKYKMSIVFIAHDLEMVNYVADRICVVYKGKIVEMGPASSVYKRPVHPYTKALINAQPSIKKPGKKLRTSEYDPSSHRYNEYKDIKEWEVRKGHFIYGTKEEAIKWSKNKSPKQPAPYK